MPLEACLQYLGLATLRNNITMDYLVTAPHRSEYPAPLILEKGDLLVVGDRYQGPEKWDNWIYCSTSTHAGGWVPEQIIEHLPETDTGRALEDYSAMEMNVDKGDLVQGDRLLNGWCWCLRAQDGAQGWVPISHLSPLPSTP